MIKITNLHKSYNIGKNKLHVLKGLNLSIGAGEMVSIMGSSGSGKSTLLNILGILDSYNEGEYVLNNTLIKKLTETKAAKLRNQYLGFVFQSFNLLSVLSMSTFTMGIALGTVLRGSNSSVEGVSN